MANMITIFRMAGSILLLFLPVFSPWFYGIYLLCGLTDIADGIAAIQEGHIIRTGKQRF